MAYQATAITEDQNHVVDFDGFSLHETGGAAASAIEFRDGAVDGNLLWVLDLAASQSASIIFPARINNVSGVFVKTTGAGVVAGTILSEVS